MALYKLGSAGLCDTHFMRETGICKIGKLHTDVTRFKVGFFKKEVPYFEILKIKFEENLNRVFFLFEIIRSCIGGHQKKVNKQA